MPKKEKDLLNEIRKIVGEVNKCITQNTSRYIIAYCRVSDFKQIGNNSIDTQLNHIKVYASENNLKIIKVFDVMGESSKRGNSRPSIDDLLRFINETEYKIREVVVFHSNRLTRDGDYGAKFLDKLISKGVGFRDLDDPNNIFNETGRINQIDAFYGAERENITRKKFINSSVLKKLKQGYTMRRPPLGYELVKFKGKNKKQKIVLNKQGELIRQVFRLKLDYNYSNVMIYEIMKARGLETHHKMYSKMFRNVYYCGLIKDKRLVDSGGIVEGRHPSIITLEEFSILNSKNRRNIKKNEIEDLPLRRHLICSKCNERLTGYRASKRKNLFYYKCNTKGCNVNIRNDKLHKLYSECLKQFSFDKKYLPQMRHRLDEVFKIVDKSNIVLRKNLNIEIKKIEKERFLAIKNMNTYSEDRNIYKELINDCDTRINELMSQLNNIKIGADEVRNKISESLHFVNDLSTIWLNCDYKFKIKLQELIFPDGVMFCKKSNTLKPVKVNPIFSIIKGFRDDLFDMVDSRSIFKGSEKKGENFDKNRTQIFLDEIGSNPNENKAYGDDFFVDGEEKFSLVNLGSHTSNNFDDKLIDSMTELIRFNELYRLINNNF